MRDVLVDVTGRIELNADRPSLLPGAEISAGHGNVRPGMAMEVGEYLGRSALIAELRWNATGFLSPVLLVLEEAQWRRHARIDQSIRHGVQKAAVLHAIVAFSGTLQSFDGRAQLVDHVVRIFGREDRLPLPAHPDPPALLAVIDARAQAHALCRRAREHSGSPHGYQDKAGMREHPPIIGPARSGCRSRAGLPSWRTRTGRGHFPPAGTGR